MNLRSSNPAGSSRAALRTTPLLLLLLTACFGACFGACSSASTGDSAARRRELAEQSYNEAANALALGEAERALTVLDGFLESTADLGKDFGYRSRMLAGKANLEMASQELRRSSKKSGRLIDGLLDDAVGNFELASSLMPDKVAAALALARACQRKGFWQRMAQAASSARERVMAKPKSKESHIDLSEALRLEGHAKFQELVALRRGEIENEEELSESAIIIAHQALALFKAAIDSDPRNDEAYGWSADTYAWIEQPLDAMNILENSIRANPKAHAHHDRLQRLYDTRQAQTELVALYKRLNEELELPSADMTYYLAKAQAIEADKFRASGDREAAEPRYRGAEASYLRSGDINPDYRGNADVSRAICALSIANMAFDDGETKAAESELDRCFRISPRIGEMNGATNRFWDARGKTYQGSVLRIGTSFGRRWDEAARFWRKICKRHPNWGEAWNNLGFTLRELGSQQNRNAGVKDAMATWEESYSAYLIAVKHSPADPRIVNDTGLMLVYHLKRDWEKAKAFFHKAIEIGTAKLDVMEEEDDEDIAPLQRTARRDVEDAIGDAWQNLGQLYAEHEKKPKRAITHYRRSMEYWSPNLRASVRTIIQQLEAQAGSGSGSGKKEFVPAEPTTLYMDGSALIASLDLGPLGQDKQTHLRRVQRILTRKERKQGTQEPTSRPLDPNALERQGKFAEAIVAWRVLVKRHPTDAMPILELVRLLKSKGQIDAALEALTQAVESFPKDYDLLLQMSLTSQEKAEQLALGQGDNVDIQFHLDDAATYAELACELRPGERIPRSILGMAQLKLMRHDEAMSTAKILVKNFSSHPGGHILQAELHFVQYVRARRDEDLSEKEVFNLLGKARQGYSEAIRLDKKRHLPYRRLGDLAAYLGDKRLALAMYMEALARKPSRGAPFQWIVQNIRARQRLAFYEESLQMHKDLTTRPEIQRALLHWHAGLTAFQLEDWKKTRSQMTHAFQLQPAYLNALFYFGIASYNLEDFDAALTALSLYATDSPKDLLEALRAAGKKADTYAAYLTFLAEHANEKGQLVASRDLNHVAALFSNDADTWNNYAFLCRETKKYEEAYKGYLAALTTAPNDPNILNDCALILQYHLNRDLGKARSMYELAIKNAKAILLGREATKEAKTRARQAISDASGNLKKLQ